ncbi:disulfide bond formation protein B [soil metagenome]
MLMTIDTRTAALAVFFISALTVIGAWIFQVAGYAPCPLCLMQRWAYYAAVPVSLVTVMMVARDMRIARVLLVLIGLAFVANAVFGVYHAGVEWKFWPGPGTCSGTLSGGLPTLGDTPVISCEDAAIRILGLSLAGWNALISAALALVAFAGARRYGSSSVSQ